MKTKRTHRAAIAAIAAAAVISLLTLPAQAGTPAPERIAKNGKIVFCTDISFPPFEYFDPQTNEPAGFDIDIGKALAAEMGIKSEHKNIAFDGLIPALQAGQCDAILSGLFDKPARREVLDFVNYAYVGNAVIVKADSPLKFDALTDISGKAVAVESGSTLEQDLVDANTKLAASGKAPIKIVALPKASDAFQQLTTGLVDIYYGSTVQEAYFNSQNASQVKLASPQTSAFYTGVGTLKKDADLHDALAAAFKAIQASGEYDKIVKAWKFDAMAYKP
ncbi:ABC transporter substrate-binding protein [Hypericibacter terrae]|jgi:polar amino acid transport system substrate-binding protein|uniref:ABC transporter substrate-binding protein n=1 Tax=Hypericibacter terrae TaxID=2602015 RepID=A0A5J6MET2_9PROT|nr:ABC transporter substrate-binding protein [Hypericibacter terrae]QEX15983.1 ABC transporter substrate-binding protein [Hypericibacter terrae]